MTGEPKRKSGLDTIEGRLEQRQQMYLGKEVVCDSILKKLDVLIYFMTEQPMKIYRVEYVCDVFCQGKKSHDEGERFNVSAKNADHASEKVKTRLEKKKPEPEWIDGKKYTFTRKNIVINSINLLAESDF